MIKFDGHFKRIAFDLGGIVFDLDAWGVEGLSKIALQILFVLFSFPFWGTSPGVWACVVRYSHPWCWPSKKDVTKIERNPLIHGDAVPVQRSFWYYCVWSFVSSLDTVSMACVASGEHRGDDRRSRFWTKALAATAGHASAGGKTNTDSCPVCPSWPRALFP